MLDIFKGHEFSYEIPPMYDLTSKEFNDWSEDFYHIYCVKCKIILAIPWGYFRNTYILKPGQYWRSIYIHKILSCNETIIKNIIE